MDDEPSLTVYNFSDIMKLRSTLRMRRVGAHPSKLA
jgi:hypothetical protein